MIFIIYSFNISRLTYSDVNSIAHFEDKVTQLFRLNVFYVVTGLTPECSDHYILISSRDLLDAAQFIVLINNCSNALNILLIWIFL